MALMIENNNLKDVLDANELVVVDFWAEWCGPCRQIAPYVEELATEYAGRIAVAKCDVDANDELAGSYGIRTIPTLLFFKNGEVVDKHVGSAAKNVLKEKFEALL